MSGYIGNIPVPQSTQTRDNFTATSGQTTFSTSGYTPNYLDVYLNGVHLDPSDYTATNGTDVVLGTGATAGDIVSVVAFSTFETVDQDFSGDFSVDGNTFVVDSTNDRVGIGTSSPSAGYKLTLTEKMYISSNADVTPDGNWSGQLTIGGNGYSGGLALDASGIWLGSNSSARSVIFATNETERMRIDSSGNVGMGKSAYGSISTDGFWWDGASNYLAMSGTGTSPLYLNRNGSDGGIINFYKAGTNVGSISVTGSSTSYNTSSDYRLKTDVQPMTGATDRLKALNPVNFEWISSGERVDGFLAHEAQEVVPEAVSGTKDGMTTEKYEITPAEYEDVVIPAVLDDEGNEIEPERTEQRLVTEAVMGEREVPDYQGIDQSKLVPLLVAAMQEQQTVIEDLKARIEALEGASA